MEFFIEYLGEIALFVTSGFLYLIGKKDSAEKLLKKRRKRKKKFEKKCKKDAKKLEEDLELLKELE